MQINKKLSQVRSTPSMLSQRKGSHVGFVISFVLFVTFIVFIYVLLNSRLDLGQDKQNSLEYVKSEIIERVSENLTITSLSTNKTVFSENCFLFTDFISKTSVGNRLMVQNDSGEVFAAYSSSDLTDLYINRAGSTASDFFRVYSSDKFLPITIYPETPSPCVNFNEGAGYTIGLSKEETYVFESKVLELLNNYTTDYEALKKDIKISSNDEFGFVFTYNNKTEIKTPEINATINIYSERVPIQYIKTDSKREIGFIDVLVW